MTMTRLHVAIAVAMSAVACTPALSFAAEPGPIGLSAQASSTPALGVEFRLTPRLVLRPSLIFYRSSRVLGLSPAGAFETVESTGAHLGASLDLLYHPAPDRRLSPYLFAGLGVSRPRSMIVNDAGSYASWIEEGRGGLGLEYAFGHRLSAFAESGLSYNWSRGQGSFTTVRSRAGLSFHFK